MSTQVDPYRDWLGIKSPHRPPNHYELLDLPLYESDRERIENSEMIQMVKVLRHESGPDSEQAGRLAKELEEAVRCLSDPADKAAYDAGLVMDSPSPHTVAGDFEISPALVASKSTYEDVLSEEPPRPASSASKTGGSRLAAAKAADNPGSHVLSGSQPNSSASSASKAVSSWMAATPSAASASSVKHDKVKPPPKPVVKPAAVKGPSRLSLPEMPSVSAKHVGLAIALTCLVAAVWWGMKLYNRPAGHDGAFEMLSSTDPQKRIAGVDYIQRVGLDSGELCTLLLKILKEEESGEVRLAAVNGLVNTVVPPDKLDEIKSMASNESQPDVKTLLEWLVQRAGKS